MAPFLPCPSSMWSFQFPHHLCAQYFPASRSLTPFLATLSRSPQLLIGDPGPVGSAKPFGAISPIPFPFNFLRTLLHAEKSNSLLFNRFRTLCQKTPGVGGTPFCYYPASHPRRRHELYPKARRNPRWLRASLLGRQHHGDLRAPLLLWRVRFPRQLSARKAGFSHRADRHA